jgi:HEAT repeat protein
MKSVAPALCRALTSTDDDVRIPALHALGRVAAGENTLNVLAVATDARAQKPVRLAALDALARILEAQDQVPPGVFAELVPVSSDKDTDVAIAAGRAIAVAKFDPAQFTDLLVLKRVQEVKAGR